MTAGKSQNGVDKMGYQSLAEIASYGHEKGLSFWEVIVMEDMQERGVTMQESMEKMSRMYEAMRTADAGYEGKLRSSSRLVGGDGQKVQEYFAKGESLCGEFIGRTMERAIKMGESNACMKRIVAAPTAGSCGVLPAVLLTMEEMLGFSNEQMIKAMFVAAGIGEVIAYRAFIAGAQGGCQAEIGSASAMAAGAAAYLKGADNEGIIHASALALKNLLGLACDPVAGLVEVPCVKRNVLGAVNALTSADLVLAGVRSAIPPDEVIDAMRAIGLGMPAALRETGEGGLAATPTGVEIAGRLK